MNIRGKILLVLSLLLNLDAIMLPVGIGYLIYSLLHL